MVTGNKKGSSNYSSSKLIEQYSRIQVLAATLRGGSAAVLGHTLISAVYNIVCTIRFADIK